MKIKNFINIKANGKSIDFHNLILNELLERYVKRQLILDGAMKIRTSPFLGYLLLKFDTPFQELSPDSELHNADFDVGVLWQASFSESVSAQQIVVTYKYNVDTTMQFYKYGTGVVDGNEWINYIGKKIMAIGFNSWPSDDSSVINKYPVCAVLDTSKYNISLEENQEFVVTRKDTIISDADFWSNDSRIKGPIHFTVHGGPSLLYQDSLYKESIEGGASWVEAQPTYGQLYSVGFSSYKDSIAKEYILGEDVTAVNNGTSISIDGLQTKMKQYTYCPLQSIFPFSGLFPLKSSYKYIVFKYKLFQTIYTRNPDYVEGGDESEFIGTWTDTGAYYLQSVPLSKYGKTNLTIKYERGN